MKPLLIALSLTLCVSTNAQFIKFKCYQSATYKGYEYAKDVPESRYSDVNILVTIDLHARQIKTYGLKKGEYSLIKVIKSQTNDNGDMHVRYEAVDEGGSDCTLTISSFADKSVDNVASIVVDYVSFGLIFRLATYN